MSRKLTVSQALLDTLAEAGVRDIFGVTGDALNPLLETIRTDDRFRWIGVRHEETAAYAAFAQSEITGGIGVCAGSTGPGALHLINGLYSAKKDAGAVVAITGQVPRGERGSDFHKEVDMTSIFAHVCDYQVVIDAPSQMPRMAQIAVQRALWDRVVTRIELPADIVAAAVPSEHFRHPLVCGAPSIVPPDEQVARAAGLINEGKRVTLFCGIGCRDCADEVRALASTLKAPIVHTLRAKDIFELDEANVVGLTGLIGNPAGYHAVQDCDVLVMLGTDFPYDEFIPDGLKIVQVDRNVDHIGRRAPVDVGLIGTVKDTLAVLAPKIRPGESSRFLDHLCTLRDNWLDHMEKQGSLSRTDEPLHPQLFARAVSDKADDDAFFAIDVGECTVWMARQMRMAGGRRMASSFNHGSIGCGLPIALGAASVDPSRQVWAMCGDGGFGMSMNDFVTAVRYGWPIKVLVYNNGELGFVKMEVEVAGLPDNPAATGLHNPDFAAYARACGGDGVRVEHAADIVPAVERAIASDKPFIIDAVVSAGELTMPPKITVGEAWGFGISKIKEALLGVRGDHDVWKAWRDEFKANVHA